MSVVAQIRRACRELDRDRPEAAIEILDGASPSTAGEALELVARALAYERAGDTAQAARHFDRALELGVPLLTVLRECGRYYKRAGDYERAHHCYALLRNMWPPATREFLAGLPAPALARYAPWAVREHVPRPRPRHWFYPPIKDALVGELGLKAGALSFALMAGNRPGDLLTLPMRPLRDFARSSAAVYEELYPSRERRVQPPPVLGAEQAAGMDIRTRTFFFAVLQDLVISSKSNFLIVEGHALLDYQDDELDRIPHDLSVDPILFHRHEGEVSLHVEGGALSGPPLERAFPLVGVNSYNFGHWLVEFLPKVWACRDRPGFESVPFLVDEQMHPQLLPALELFAGRDHPVVVLKRGEAVRVSEAWVCSSIVYWPLGAGVYAPDVKTIDGDAFASLVASVRPAAPPPGPGARRVYLARKDSQHRSLVNREEVEAWFAARGFEIVDLGDRPFAEQIELLQTADLVVGPDGSAFYLAFFARPGTGIGILNNPHLEDHWWIGEACRSLDLALLIMTGEVSAEHEDPTKSDYRIDVDRLPAFLDKLASRSSVAASPQEPTVTQLMTACRCLEDGRPEAALEVVGQDPDSTVARSLSWVARGLLLERDGRSDSARELFDQAFSAGVPLATLLRECGRFYARMREYERAHHCYAVLDSLDHRAMMEFLLELPPAELSRYAPWALAKGRRPGPWVVWLVKRALAETVGRDAAALAFAHGTGLPTASRITDVPLVGLQDFVRTEGLPYRELVRGRTVHLPALPVFGRPPGDGLEARTRDVFLAVLSDVVIQSKSDLLLTAGRALLDYQHGELEKVQLDMDVDPTIFGWTDETVTVVVDGSAPARPSLERAFTLVGVNSQNFGHWLLEFIPKVWAVLGQPGFEAVPILTDQQMPRQHREALRMFAGADRPVIELKRGDAVRVEELWACSMLLYVPLAPRAGAVADRSLMILDADAFAALVTKVEPALPPPTPGPSRIYLSRGELQHRRLVNRTEVEEWFAAHGFEVLDFGKLTFAEQVSLMRGCDVVVGPDGSSFMTTFLAGPGTRIGVLDNPYPQEEWYAQLCRTLGQRLCYLLGEVVREDPDYWFNADYRIDVAALPGFLDELMAG